MWIKKYKICSMQIILSCLLIIASHIVFALKSDEQQDLKLDANNATLDYKNKVTVFTGNVVITRGSLVVHADKGMASEDKDQHKMITLYGAPVTFVQLQDDGEKIEGQGNQFDYNAKTNLAILSGRARVKKGKNIVIGEKITYNMVTQVYSASATPANGINKQTSGRITVILDPGSKTVQVPDAKNN